MKVRLFHQDQKKKKQNKNKNGKKDDNRNVLLEFTATIPEIQKVIDKYADAKWLLNEMKIVK